MLRVVRITAITALLAVPLRAGTSKQIKSYYAEIVVDSRSVPVKTGDLRPSVKIARTQVWADETKQKKIGPSKHYVVTNSRNPDVLWIMCGEGFEVESITQDPSGDIFHEGNMASPELHENRVTTVMLTCKRK